LVQHADLTGADLHEPKGADSASVNTVYVADGSGSGTWNKIGSTSIDTTSIKNTNKGKITVEFRDIGTARSIYIPFSEAVTITQITTVVDLAPSTADTILTCYNALAASMGTITIAVTGAAAGDVDTLTPASNNTVSANSYMRIATDGGCANTPNAMIQIDYTIT
jgi:hypothetical protein